MWFAKLLLLVSIAAVAGCDMAKTPSALDKGPPPAADQATQSVVIPFSAHATFAVVPDAPSVACTPLRYGIHPPALYGGTGTASHLGLMETVITFDACTIDPTAGRFLASGHVVQTAANGDQLSATFEMTQQNNGDFTLDAVTITGGTGRFENATGSGTGSGWISRGEAGTYQGYYDMQGTMSRPNH